MAKERVLVREEEKGSEDQERVARPSRLPVRVASGTLVKKQKRKSLSGGSRGFLSGRRSSHKPQKCAVERKLVSNAKKALSMQAMERQTLLANNKALARSLEREKEQSRELKEANLKLQQENQELKVALASGRRNAALVAEEVHPDAGTAVRAEMAYIQNLVRETTININRGAENLVQIFTHTQKFTGNRRERSPGFRPPRPSTPPRKSIFSRPSLTNRGRKDKMGSIYEAKLTAEMHPDPPPIAFADDDDDVPCYSSAQPKRKPGRQSGLFRVPPFVSGAVPPTDGPPSDFPMKGDDDEEEEVEEEKWDEKKEEQNLATILETSTDCALESPFLHKWTERRRHDPRRETYVVSSKEKPTANKSSSSLPPASTSRGPNPRATFVLSPKKRRGLELKTAVGSPPKIPRTQSLMEEEASGRRWAESTASRPSSYKAKSGSSEGVKGKNEEVTPKDPPPPSPPLDGHKRKQTVELVLREERAGVLQSVNCVPAAVGDGNCLSDSEAPDVPVAEVSSKKKSKGCQQKKKSDRETRKEPGVGTRKPKETTRMSESGSERASSEESETDGRRRRRAVTNVCYREPSTGSKLRQGDAFFKKK